MPVQPPVYPNPARRKAKVISALPGGVLLISLAAAYAAQAAEPVENPAGTQQADYQIRPQSLDKALVEFSLKTGLQVVADGNLTAGAASPGVTGRYSPEQALQKLLAGSGVAVQSSRNGTVTLEKAKAPVQEPQSAPAVLPKVNVVGTAVYDATNPYNQDYVLPNATAGTKTDTPIMETPLNVQVISKQVMKDQQAITLGDALKNVSGVIVNSSGSLGDTNSTNLGTNTNITLRGFDSTTTFRNGFRLQGGGNRNMSNVESVEVLKGPAAILYGLVEPGGMINVVTKQPQATPYYALNQQFGSFDNYRTTIDATGPVAGNKDVLYRMNMAYQNSGSVQDYVNNEDIFLAPVLKWNISPKTQVTAEFEYNRQNNHIGNSFNPYIGGQLTNNISANWGAPSPTVTETFFGSLNWSHQFNDDWSVKHRFASNQQGFTGNYQRPQLVTSNAILEGFGVSPGLFNGLGVLRTPFGNVAQSNTYSTNMDLTGHFDTFGLKHTVLFGGDYYKLNNTLTVVRNSSPLPWSVVDPFNPVNPGIVLSPNLDGSPDIGQQQETDQYGLYGQDQIKLPFNVHVTGGLRYQYLHQNTIGTTSGLGGNTFTAAAVSQDAVTPRVGILWHPQSWVSLYANYAESFGANTGLVWGGATGSPKPVVPTSATQYEGGVKTEFFDGRLRATLAYFDLTKTNVAAGDPDLTHNCGGGGGDCSIAVGAVRSRGPELDIQGEILPGWNAIATWANTDIVVTKSSPNTNLSTGLYTYAIGNRLLNVPRNTATFWSTYELQDTDFKGLKFGTGVTVRNGTIGTSGGSDVTHVPDYATLDLMTAYSRAIGKSKVTIQFNITNLLDKNYFTTINGSTNIPSFPLYAGQAAFGAPRTVMGSINIQY